jgi:2-polyprenyl-6-methoxyphenol hydroxylase-like FAD-dependent oxidoreductase
VLVGDAAGIVSPLTGGGIHTALHYGRRAAQLIGDHLFDRGPHPLAAFSAEIPRYRFKRLLRRALDFAPPNALIDLMLMTPQVRAIAQRIYFHRRGGDWEEFDSWQREFGRQDFEPQPPKTPNRKLRCA